MGRIVLEDNCGLLLFWTFSQWFAEKATRASFPKAYGPF
jgi:hypothetical protein